MSLTIGVPIIWPYVHWKFWKTYEEMIKPKDHKLQIVTGTTISVARNRLVRFGKDTDYFLFLDSDMVPPPHLIENLMENKKDIVSALAFQRSYPHEPITFRLWKPGDYYRTPPTGELVDVDATGMACCLIKTEVFKNIKDPWFDFSPYKGGDPNIEFYGEDISFCRKAKKAGYKIYVDTSIEVGHIIDRIITGNDWRPPKVRDFKEFDEARDKC